MRNIYNEYEWIVYTLTITIILVLLCFLTFTLVLYHIVFLLHAHCIGSFLGFLPYLHRLENKSL